MSVVFLSVLMVNVFNATRTNYYLHNNVYFTTRLYRRKCILYVIIIIEQKEERVREAQKRFPPAAEAISGEKLRFLVQNVYLFPVRRKKIHSHRWARSRCYFLKPPKVNVFKWFFVFNWKSKTFRKSRSSTFFNTLILNDALVRLQISVSR